MVAPGAVVDVVDAPVWVVEVSVVVVCGFVGVSERVVVVDVVVVVLVSYGLVVVVCCRVLPCAAVVVE